MYSFRIKSVFQILTVATNNLCCCLVVCAAGASAPVVRADDNTRGFWSKGSASDFRLTPVANSSSTIEFADGPRIKRAEEKAAQDEDGVAMALLAGAENKSSVPTSSQHQKIANKDEVIANYGDPSKDRDLTLEPTAPPELKGMAAALSIGDRDLAFQYARAHVRYQHQINKFVDRSVEYQMAALKLEGIKKPDASDNDESNPYLREIEPTLKRTKEELRPKVGKDTQDLIRKAKEEQDRESITASDEVEVASARIPVAPDGRVQVMFFFSFDNTDSIAALPLIKDLSKQLATNPNVEFIGLSQPARKAKEIEALKKQYGLTFPVINGEAIAEKLRIVSIPAVLFAAPASGETYSSGGVPGVEDGIRVVKVMQGAKQ